MELRAEDLRLGNYVYSNNYNSVYKIVMFLGLQDLTLISELGYDEHDKAISDLKPIPLTEEWLLKFGFEYNSTHLIFEDKNGFIIDRDFEANEKFSVYIEMLNKDIVLEYVHQLQNFCYSISGGKELQVL